MFQVTTNWSDEINTKSIIKENGLKNKRTTLTETCSGYAMKHLTLVFYVHALFTVDSQQNKVAIKKR